MITPPASGRRCRIVMPAFALTLLVVGLILGAERRSNVKSRIHVRPPLLNESMQEFLVRRGYPYEDHEVFTPDGYILSLQRIPNPGAMPVLLVHGNFFDAWAWISGPNERSPGQQLYEAGFDVWLANNRGTPYGRRHVTLGEGREVDQNAKFWNWTYSTLARNDCPAIVAKVLHETGAERINYVGWSRGTNQAFIAMQDPALKAYFERHINIATMIAPVTYSKHTSSLSLQSLAAARAFDLLHRVWPYGFLSSDAVQSQMQML